MSSTNQHSNQSLTGRETTLSQALPVIDTIAHWTPIVGGGALALYGLSRRSVSGITMALLGSALSYWGAVRQSESVRIEEAVTINATPEVLYTYWRNFENWTSFMSYLESVHITDARHAHWVAQVSDENKVHWDTEIIADQPHEFIIWRVVTGGASNNAGCVRFRAAPGNRGTEVRVFLEYAPPGGLVGSALAPVAAFATSKQLSADLRRLKQMIEAGEIPTTEGQTSGREEYSDEDYRHEREMRFANRTRDLVDEASWESFPASDAPAWTCTHAGPGHPETTEEIMETEASR